MGPLQNTTGGGRAKGQSPSETTGQNLRPGRHKRGDKETEKKTSLLSGAKKQHGPPQGGVFT